MTLDLYTLPEGTVHDACQTSDQLTECGGCYGVWCDRCDPAHGPLCPWCHGYGYSSAPILAPRYRQANHVHPSDAPAPQVTRTGPQRCCYGWLPESHEECDCD